MTWVWPWDERFDSVDEKLDRIEIKLNQVIGQELTISRKESYIMGAVQVQQEDLDALDVALDQATQSLSDKIDALEAAGNIPAGDLQPLKDDLATLQGLSAPTPTG